VHTNVFRWLLGLTFVGMFFSQSYVQIMPVFADLVGTDERGYGYLLSAGGLGSVMGTLLVGSLQESRRLGTIMLGGAGLSVFMLLTFAWASSTGNFPAALGLAFLTAAAASSFMIISMTVMQLLVPDALRGRVMGIHTIGYSLVPLGGLFLGALADSFNAGMAVTAGGMIYLAAIIVTAFSQKEIREMDGSALQGGAHGPPEPQPAATR
jgi:predicted MFS family arabinose efflux permease